MDGVSQKIKAVIGPADKALGLAVQAQFQISGDVVYLPYGLFKVPPGYVLPEVGFTASLARSRWARATRPDLKPCSG